MKNSYSNEQIDVENIMNEIKRKVKQKKVPAIYDTLIQEDFKYFRTRCFKLLNAERMAKIELDYKIECHKPVVGPLIRFFKKTFFSAIKLLLRPIFDRQEEFNTSIVEYIKFLAQSIEKLGIEIQSKNYLEK